MIRDAVDHATSERPFLGLSAFTEADGPFFHGRVDEIDELLRCIRRDPLTILFGRSGLGKTSLVQAGLFPRLRESGCLPIKVRIDFADPDRSALEQIRVHVIQVWKEQGILVRETPGETISLWELLHSNPRKADDGKPIIPVLVLDQFEEIFTRHGELDEPTRAFIEELSDLVQNQIPATVRMKVELLGISLPLSYTGAPARVVISLREDYLPLLENFGDQIPNLMANRMRLMPLRGSEALRAVLRQGGALVGREVAEEIVWFVSKGGSFRADESAPIDELNVEPFLLSLVCQQLNERRIERGEPQITAALLAEMGDRVLVDFYERATDGLGDAARVLVEDHLITRQGFRTLKAVPDALMVEGVDEDLIDELVNRKLVRRDDRLGITHLELVHDVMAPVVKEARDRRVKQEEELQRRAEADAVMAEDRARVRRWSWGLAGALVLTVGAAIFFYDQKKESDELREQAEVARATAETQKDKLETQKNKLEDQTRKLEQHQKDLEQQRKERARLEAVPLRFLAQQQVDRGQVDLALRNSLDAYAGLIDSANEDAINGALRLILGFAVQTRSTRLLQGVQARAAWSLALGPGGRQFASGSESGSILIWDRPTGESQVLNGHQQRVNSLTFHPGGKLLASASNDGTVRVWDLEKRVQRHVLTGHEMAVSAVLFVDEGTKLVSAGWDGKILLWDVGTARLRRTLAEMPEDVNRLVLNKDGRTAAGPCDDGTIVLVDVLDPSRSPRLLFGGHEETPIFAVQFDPTGQFLASGDTSGRVCVWDVKTGTLVSTTDEFPAGVTCLDWLPDGHTLLVGGESESVLALRPDDGEFDYRLIGNAGGVRDLIVFDGGRRVVAACGDGRVRVHDLVNRVPVWSLPQGFGAILDLELDADRGHLFASGRDGSVQVWDLRVDLIPRRRLPVSQSEHFVAVSPDGRRVLTRGSAQGARIRNVFSADETILVQLPPETAGITAAAFAADDSTLFTAAPDGLVQAWSMPDGLQSGTPIETGGTVRVMRCLAGGRVVAQTESGSVVTWVRGEDAALRLDLAPIQIRDLEPLGDESIAVLDARHRVHVLDLPPTGGGGDLIERAVHDIERAPDTEVVRLMAGGLVLVRGADGSLSVKRPTSPEGSVSLEPGPAGVADAALLSDGKTVAVAAPDGIVHLFDAQDGGLIGRADSQLISGGITSIVPAGSSLVVLGSDGSASLLSPVHAELDPVDIVLAGGQQCGAYSRDGAWIATGKLQTVKLWELLDDGLTGLEPTRTVELGRDDAYILTLAFSPEGRYLAGGDTVGEITIWDVLSGERVEILRGHTDRVWGLAYVGGRLVSRSDDGRVLLWDLDTGETDHTWSDHGGSSVYDIAFSPAGLLATCGGDGAVAIRPVADPSADAARIEGFGADVVPTACEFSPDGTVLAVGDSAGDVRVFRTSDLQLVAELIGPRSVVLSTHFSSDGTSLLVLHADASFHLWSTRDWELLKSAYSDNPEAEGQTFSMDPQRPNALLIYNGDDPRIWRVTYKDEWGVSASRAREASKIMALSGAWSSDGLRTIVGQGDGSIIVRDEAGRTLERLSGHEHPVLSVRVLETDEGDQYVSACDGGRVIFWDGTTLQKLREVADQTRGHGNSGIGAAWWDPARTRLVTGGADGKCILWPFEGGPPAAILSLPDNESRDYDIFDVQFDPTGRWLVTSWSDGLVRIWPGDVSSNSHTPAHELGLHTDKVWTARFSRDGRRLLTGGDYGMAILWDTTTWRPIARLDGHDTERPVYDADFHPDDSIVATAGGDGLVRLWDAHTGDPLLTLTGHDGGVMSVRWSPDGSRLLTAGIDGVSLIFELPFEHRHPDDIRAAFPELRVDGR